MTAFRWCYIGCGSIAKNTSKSIEKGGHVISAVWSRNYEKAKAFADKHGAKAYKTPQEAMADCDAVYIATPHTSHKQYALMAMNMGKPVLCEKPVAVCEKDADEMFECAGKNDVYFCEAMWSWFSSVPLKVKEWINSGEIGDIKSVVIHHAFPGMMMPKNGRLRNPATAGGALLDIGIYPITYCYNIFGYPEEIVCNGQVKDGIDIAETVTLKYRGFECRLVMSLKTLREGCTFTGTKGKITLPMFHVAPFALMKNESGLHRFSGVTDYLTEFNAVADEIRQGKKQSAYIPFESTKMCLRIMDECRRQMNLVYPFE